MPGSNLTRIEAEERKAVIEAPIHYHVDLDLTVGAKNFGSKSLICFNAKPGSSTFLDLIADEVTSIDSTASPWTQPWPSRTTASN